MQCSIMLQARNLPISASQTLTLTLTLTLIVKRSYSMETFTMTQTTSTSKAKASSTKKDAPKGFESLFMLGENMNPFGEAGSKAFAQSAQASSEVLNSLTKTSMDYMQGAYEQNMQFSKDLSGAQGLQDYASLQASYVKKASQDYFGYVKAMGETMVTSFKKTTESFKAA